MAHRSVDQAISQLVKTCDEISNSESSAAFTSTRSCSGNDWRAMLLPERAGLTMAVAADLPNHVAEHAALLCLSGAITRRPSCAASRRES